MPAPSDSRDMPSDAALSAVLNRILATVNRDLDEKQVERVRKGIAATHRAIEGMQQVNLENGDEPYFVFRAHNPEG